MGHIKRNSLITTVKDKCRVCYTCVRECPVKAIRIINGQAEIINEKCIGCGNCVRVCSQGAKVFLDCSSATEQLLSSENKVIACIAPSFPAEFVDIADYKSLVGMIKELGFDKVIEVGFGADLIAEKYKSLINSDEAKTYISSDCPAIVFYIEQYHPDLIKNLSPIASPMVATTRVIRKKYGADTKVVFIGPCIAKKAESDEVDEVITYIELRELFAYHNITPENVKACRFDAPEAGKGSILAVTRGLLQTINKNDSIIEGEIINASGQNNFKELISEFEEGKLDVKYMELLCCNGCIMGPGMSQKNDRYTKRIQIRDYVRQKFANFDQESWEANYNEFKDIDLTQTFSAFDRRPIQPSETDIQKVLLGMGKKNQSDYLNCGACGYHTCREHAIAIIQGLAEIEMCLPYTIEKLHKSIGELNESNENLADARQALKQSEKLANMGQLSAGIAHEINNPLGVITMYSNILKDELSKDDPIREDLELIVEQTARCKKIVGGLLNFARKNNVIKKETNVKKFVQHSLETVIFPENVKLEVKSELTDEFIMIDQDQMMQVLTNMEKNSVEAMPDGGTLSISIIDKEDRVKITIADTGTGIAKENMDKLFTPFFTTKEIGKGTGLGLPLVYGIVKMHQGKIDIITNNDIEKGPTGTSFIIDIPRN
jgi:signal transduction histidine kinase/iron only hydrogenase large subunit-like protein